jgi:hypothetical protein
MFAAGRAPKVPLDPVYVEDVFSTFLYTGTNTSGTNIVNNIDLSTKGGMVWIKNRTTDSSYGGAHQIVDTARGLSGANSSMISSNSTDQATGNYAEGTASNQGFSSFNSNGFTLKSVGGEVRSGSTNTSGVNYASWTFRKQPKFFDIVTYTGNGVGGRQISHNLGSVPGFILVKRLNETRSWAVYHRSLGANKYLNLNATTGVNAGDYDGYWDLTEPTSTVFTVRTDGDVNTSGGAYVAYLFAHNAGGFGLTGTDNIITCGSYTGNGTLTGVNVTTGFETQFVMIKKTDSTSAWVINDIMRNASIPSDGIGIAHELNPNTNSIESTNNYGATPRATGFNVSGNGILNLSGSTYIYIAIRRPMKVPTVGTSVFEPVQAITVSGNGTPWPSPNFAPDTLIMATRTGTENRHWFDRLRGTNQLQPNVTGAETGYTSSFWTQNGFGINSASTGWLNYIGWNLRRAPGFFDIVDVITNQQAAAITSTHNLNVVPEMMIAKKRGPTGGTGDWMVYHKGLNGGVTPQNYRIRLNGDGAEGTGSGVWNNTAPTATQFTIGTDSDVNSGSSGDRTVVYLFATCPGVSKVGSYTGNGTSFNVECGFSGGARFVLIKRTDDTGSWWVFDTVRGINAGNDPYLILNNTGAENNGFDMIDPYSGGFTAVQASVNTNGANYIFLAIA